MNKIEQLSQLLEKTNCKQEFNIVEDLKSLEIAFGILKSKDFRKKLQALITKYEQSELTEVRSALLEKCRSGDTQAIKLYVEFFKPAQQIDNDDGLIDAIMGKGTEVFKDEV